MDRDIVFKHVNFSYGTSGEVLHDIDLKIPAGTTLGILGSTGSGKSTLTYLFRPPIRAAGRLRRDHHRRRGYPQHRAFAPARQYRHCFAGTVPVLKEL
ncbi:MAG: ATP-binding cassette domain-containing protein [Hominenteromicrobium sp.]|uniref:ATP-binding cassette domain-containing protein n=1 Tax=Hominenteromicrobium sp. TaxID=3073581 RepID=UPI00399F325D